MSPLRGRNLLKSVLENIQESKEQIVRLTGYSTQEGLSYHDFYEELLANSLSFCESRFDDFTDLVTDFLRTKQGGSSPILEGNKITGRYSLRIADKDEIQEDDDSPFEILESNAHSLNGEGFPTLEKACDAFRGCFIDLFRASYDNLGDDENGKDINQFLSEYEEHPLHYIELAQHFGWLKGDLDAELADLSVARFRFSFSGTFLAKMKQELDQTPYSFLSYIEIGPSLKLMSSDIHENGRTKFDDADWDVFSCSPEDEDNVYEHEAEGHIVIECMPDDSIKLQAALASSNHKPRLGLYLTATNSRDQENLIVEQLTFEPAEYELGLLEP
jgi:hypothetical protein